MIKRCPSCNRTYSDESLSFCLADGSLLSAPYDSSREEPPPTEILSPPRVVVPPTQPANVAVPTMTTLPEAHKFSAGETTELKSKRPPILWAAIAFAVIAAFIVGAFVFRAVLRNRAEAIASASPQGSPDETVSLSAFPNDNNVSAPTNSPSVSSSPPAIKNPALPTPATLDADPVLFPPNRPTPLPSDSPATDYSRIFSSKEVDSKVRILSKPEPQYTEAARKNQVTGTVRLRAVFSSSGEVTNIQAVNGLPNGLTERAIQAAKQIKFLPAMKDGHPVSTSMQVEYNFNLY